jgi:hypothetical protein
MAVWNIHEIAAMPDEKRVRNACRQIEQEVVEWGRSLGFQGREVSYGEQYSGSKCVTLHCKRRTVQVCIDGVPFAGPIRIVAGAAVTLYVVIMEARDFAESRDLTLAVSGV